MDQHLISMTGWSPRATTMHFRFANQLSRFDIIPPVFISSPLVKALWSATLLLKMRRRDWQF